MNCGQSSGQCERRSYLTAFLTALRFLTLIPVGWRVEEDGDHFGLSLIFFPVVGLLIGCGGLVLAGLGNVVFPPPVVSFLLLCYLGSASGFLHLDGVSDSGDGLLSYRNRERSLEIMKDSRVGAMGVIVVVLLLIGKYAVFLSLPRGKLLLVGLILPIAGRLAILYSMEFFPYGRREGGLGGMFYSKHSRTGAVLGTVMLFGVVVYTSNLAAGIGIVFTLIGTAFVFGLFTTRRLGGVTGDTLGATCELTELTSALLLCALWA